MKCSACSNEDMFFKAPEHKGQSICGMCGADVIVEGNDVTVSILLVQFIFIYAYNQFNYQFDMATTPCKVRSKTSVEAHLERLGVTFSPTVIKQTSGAPIFTEHENSDQKNTGTLSQFIKRRNEPQRSVSLHSEEKGKKGSTSRSLGDNWEGKDRAEESPDGEGQNSSPEAGPVSVNLPSSHPPPAESECDILEEPHEEASAPCSDKCTEVSSDSKRCRTIRTSWRHL